MKPETLKMLSTAAHDKLRDLSVSKPEIWFESETDFAQLLMGEGISESKLAFEVQEEEIIFPKLIVGQDDKKPQADLQGLQIYDALKGFTPNKASNKYIWSWISHFIYREFVIDRWPLPNRAKSKKSLTSHVHTHFFMDSGLSALFRMNVSRLWWMTYFAEKSSRASEGVFTKEEVVKHFSLNAEHYHICLNFAIFKNSIVLSEFVRVILRSANGANTEGVRELARQINIRGGAIILEAMQREKLRMMMEKLADEIMANPKYVSKRKDLRIPKSLKVLSLGAGVQSSVLALMAEFGEYGIEKPDFAIFADTGWEPPNVYKHLDWLEEQLSYPVHRVQVSNIRDDLLGGVGVDGHKFVGIPAHTINPDGKTGILRRECTGHYKIDPIHAFIREQLGLEGKSHVPKEISVEMWLGISRDEALRAKPNRRDWVTHRFPLLEQDFSRAQLMQWFKGRYPGRELPRSACIGCPYHSDSAWKDLKDSDPDSFAQAVELDEALRHSPQTRGAIKGEAFLHRSRIPLKEVDFSDTSSEEDIMAAECEGMCGI